MYNGYGNLSIAEAKLSANLAIHCALLKNVHRNVRMQMQDYEKTAITPLKQWRKPGGIKWATSTQ